MTERVPSREVETVLVSHIAERNRLRAVTDAICSSWRELGKADAAGYLADHPELAHSKSVVLELAYEEYCQRTESGEVIDRDSFCAKFSIARSSLIRRLQVHDYWAAHPADANSKATVDWPEPGEQRLGFELLEELGRGAIGRVFLAREAAIGNRPVVIKLSIGGSDEADVLGLLRHPNIVPVYSVHEEPGSGLTAVCMPYLGRATLQGVLQRLFNSGQRPVYSEQFNNTLSELCVDETRLLPTRLARRHRAGGTFIDAAIGLAEQISEALAYAHQNGVFHRDIKPSNILLTPDGRAMLLDFNLSEMAHGTSVRLGGTLPYMAPEQIARTFGDDANDVEIVDGRADIYSLGVILFEMLTGQLPFPSETTESSASIPWAKHLDLQRCELPSVAALNPLADSKLAKLVSDCLAWDPSNRPKSARELSDRLRSSRSRRWRFRRWRLIHPWFSRSLETAILSLALATAYAVATHVPYSTRQLRAGESSFLDQDFDAALDCFRNAVSSNAESIEAIVGRARSRQQLRDYSGAIDDFELAYQKDPNPWYQAAKAFCFNLQGEDAQAEHFYRLAVEAGIESGAILNNLGYSMRSGQAEEIHSWLDRAIVLEPLLPEARHNRALLELYAAFNSGRLVSEQCIEDIEIALQLRPDAPTLVYDAACVFALSQQGQDDPNTIFGLLERAINLGISPRRMATDVFFKPFSHHERYQLLLEMPTPEEPRLPTPRIVDPFGKSPYPPVVLK